MSVINRTNDVSEQKVALGQAFGPSVISGATLQIIIPYPCTLSQIIATSVAGAATSSTSAEISRFIPGSGFTVITGLGASFVVPVYGTSGYISVSLTAQGSTLLNLMAGDALTFRLNNGSNWPQIIPVVRKTQDVVTFFGSTIA